MCYPTLSTCCWHIFIWVKLSNLRLEESEQIFPTILLVTVVTCMAHTISFFCSENWPEGPYMQLIPFDPLTTQVSCHTHLPPGVGRCEFSQDDPRAARAQVFPLWCRPPWQRLQAKGVEIRHPPWRCRLGPGQSLVLPACREPKLQVCIDWKIKRKHRRPSLDFFGGFIPLAYGSQIERTLIHYIASSHLSNPHEIGSGKPAVTVAPWGSCPCRFHPSGTCMSFCRSRRFQSTSGCQMLKWVSRRGQRIQFCTTMCHRVIGCCWWMLVAEKYGKITQ